MTTEWFYTLIVQVGGVVLIFNHQLGLDLQTKWAAPFAALAMSLATMAYSFARAGVKQAATQAVARVAAARTSGQPFTYSVSGGTGGTPSPAPMTNDEFVSALRGRP